MRRTTLLALTMLLLASLAATAANQREITDTGPWGDYEAFPDVCKLSNGDLFVVFYAGYGHVSNPTADLPRGGAVWGLRSTDQGKTWSDPILVVDGELDDRDPHVTQLSNGDLLSSYFTSHYYTEDGKKKRDCDVYVVRSTDGGTTWGDPIHVTTPYKDVGSGLPVYVSGPVIQLKGSHVALPIYHGQQKGHYITAVVHSNDFGSTWTDVVPVDAETSVNFSYGFCEASIARLADDRLIILMRPGMHQAYSSDEGYTWTKATKLPHRGDAPTVIRTSDNLLIVAHRHPGTAVTISADDGETWGRPWQIDTFGGAYPGLAELDDGSIICIYYEEGKASDIRQAIFDVEPGIRLSDLDDRWPTPPPPGGEIDLRALHAAGKLEIETDMTHTDRVPGGGVTSAFDGNVSYLRAAWKASETGDATYTLKLDKEYSLTGVGLCLKPASSQGPFPETADVHVSLDGENWSDPVAHYENAATSKIVYANFDAPQKARFVKVHITEAKGWRSLNEIEIYAE